MIITQKLLYEILKKFEDEDELVTSDIELILYIAKKNNFNPRAVSNTFEHVMYKMVCESLADEEDHDDDAFFSPNDGLSFKMICLHYAYSCMFNFIINLNALGWSSVEVARIWNAYSDEYSDKAFCKFDEQMMLVSGRVIDNILPTSACALEFKLKYTSAFIRELAAFALNGEFPDVNLPRKKVQLVTPIFSTAYGHVIKSSIHKDGDEHTCGLRKRYVLPL